MAAEQHSTCNSEFSETGGAPADPIIAAIAQHRTAYGRWIEAREKLSALQQSGVMDGYVTADAAANQAAWAEDEAIQAIDRTQPVSAAGVIALRDHMLLCADRQDGIVNLKNAFTRVCDQLAKHLPL